MRGEADPPISYTTAAAADHDQHHEARRHHYGRVVAVGSAPGAVLASRPNPPSQSNSTQATHHPRTTHHTPRAHHPPAHAPPTHHPRYDHAAEEDVDCREIGLEATSKRHSWFRVEPTLRHRSEGSIVYYNDTLR